MAIDVMRLAADLCRSLIVIATLAGVASGCTEPNPCFTPPFPEGCPGADEATTTSDTSSTGEDSTESTTSSGTLSGTSLGTSTTSGGGTESSSSSTGTEIPEVVLRFDFEEEPNEVGGALDGSGNDFDAQCAQTCPSSTDGVTGRALFNDAAGFLTVAAGEPLALQQLTILVWIRDDSAPDDATTNMVVGKPYLSDGNNSYRLLTRDADEDGERELVFRIDGETTREQVLRVPFGDRLGTWVHVAATWDGETMALFVDGTEVGRTAAPIIAYDAQPLVVGADLNAFESDNFWEGALDELELLSRPLTASEIRERAQ